MPKLSIKQANKLLSELLEDVEVVADDKNADTDVDIAALNSEITGNIETLIKPNIEETIKAELETDTLGKHMGSLRTAAQRLFAIPKRDMEGKKIDEVLALCKNAIETKFSSTDEQSKQALQETIDKYEEQITTLTAQHETALAAEKNKYVQRDMQSRTLSLLEKLPRKGGDLQELAEMAQDRMAKNYDLKFNEEKKVIELYKDGKPVLNDKNKPLTDEDFINSWATKAGIVVSNTSHIKPSDVKAGSAAATPGVIKTEEAQVNTGLEAIAAWAEQE